MKSSARSVGSILISVLLISCSAWSSDPEYIPSMNSEMSWTKISLLATGTFLGTVAIAQLKNSEVIFAGLYGAGSVYYGLERRYSEDPQLEEFVVPVSLATMGILNLTLLRSEDESKSTISAVNFLGLALIGSYWYNFERSAFRFAITDKAAYFAFEF